MAVAVIKTGGKQYVVIPDKQFKIEHIPGEVGDVVTFDVLLLSDAKGEQVAIGKPTVDNATVEAEILAQGRDRKIRVVKYKSKTRYHKVYGHRQDFTKIKVIKVGDAVSTKKKAPAEKSSKKSAAATK